MLCLRKHKKGGKPMIYPPGMIARKLKAAMIFSLFLMVMTFSILFSAKNNSPWTSVLVPIMPLSVVLFIYYDKKFEKKAWAKFDRRPEYCVRCEALQQEGSHCTACGTALIASTRCVSCDHKFLPKESFCLNCGCKRN